MESVSNGRSSSDPSNAEPLSRRSGSSLRDRSCPGLPHEIYKSETKEIAEEEIKKFAKEYEVGRTI
jgi:hypothetical protein